MKRPDLISGLIMLLIAAFYLFETAKLRFWAGRTLGPGFFPLLLGIMLGVLSIILLAKTALAIKDDSLTRAVKLFPSRSGMLRLFFLVGALVVYVLTLYPLGFLLSTLLFLFFLFLVFDTKRPVFVLVLSIVIVLISFAAFKIMLHVQLPKGLLG